MYLVDTDWNHLAEDIQTSIFKIFFHTKIIEIMSNYCLIWSFVLCCIQIGFYHEHRQFIILVTLSVFIVIKG